MIEHVNPKKDAEIRMFFGSAATINHITPSYPKYLHDWSPVHRLTRERLVKKHREKIGRYSSKILNIFGPSCNSGRGEGVDLPPGAVKMAVTKQN